MEEKIALVNEWLQKIIDSPEEWRENYSDNEVKFLAKYAIEIIRHTETQENLRERHNFLVEKFDDLLASLKEQRPDDPVKLPPHHGFPDGAWNWGCPKCNYQIGYMWNFCPRCGKEVKWDAYTGQG